MNLPFNLIDVLAVLLVVAGVVMGVRSGFVVQALALAGFAAGVLLLIAAAPYAANLLTDVETPLRGLVAVAVIAAVVLLAQSLGSSVGAAIRRRFGRGVLGGIDSGAGGVFGLARGLFLVWLLGGLLAAMPLPAFAAEARQSLILRVLDARLPSPVVLAAEFGRLLEATGLPEVFVGEPPPPADLRDGPAAAEAERIAAPARPSTVRVEAFACMHLLTGTGFAIEEQHVVTNAHVVAGSSRVQVSRDGALERHEATVVHFDPELDVAVLHVPTLELEPLELSDEAPARGESAAAIGFTGGGPQRVIPAAVGRTLQAVGRDIYDRGVASRPVVELRAEVSPGDSGGPVVLAEGTVGGLTFSESRDDNSIGYALAPDAVADSIGHARDRTAPVGSGQCVP